MSQTDKVLFLLSDLRPHRGEYWKTIRENKFYAVSNLGRIASLDHFVNHSRGGLRKIKGRIMRLAKQRTGYLSLSLGGKNVQLVHRLVANAFIKNPNNKPCVNHLDGNKRNNIVDNLSWCTYSENEKYSYSHLGKKPNKTGFGKLGEKHHQSKPVALVNDNGRIIKVFGSAFDASKKLPGTNHIKINSVCCGCQKSHRGFFFKRITHKKFKSYVAD